MKEFPLFVGIDVSKDRLDVAVRPTGETWQVRYDAEGISLLGGKSVGWLPRRRSHAGYTHRAE